LPGSAPGHLAADGMYLLVDDVDGGIASFGV
jgi:hypothetical protein